MGLYVIECHGKLYVGSAVNLDARWKQHVCALRAGRHHNRHLQSAWRKHGPAAFNFHILHEMPGATPEALVAAERDAIRILAPEFNMVLDPTVPPTTGGHSEATKRKIGLANKGGRGRICGPHSAETKVKISVKRKRQGNFRQGVKHTDETILKIKGAWTPEMRAAAAERAREQHRKRREAQGERSI